MAEQEADFAAMEAAAADASSHETAVVTFIMKWDLQDEAQGILLALDPQTQQKVMVEFNPRDTSRDVNNIFCKFAKGVSGGAQVADGGEIYAFIAKWALGEDAQAMLLNMPPREQTRVMKEFRPRDAEQDANNIFMKFAQGVSKGAKGGIPYWKGYDGGKAWGKGYGKGTWTNHAAAAPASFGADPHLAAQQALANALAQQMLAQQGVASNAAADPAVQEFVLKWGLQQDAQELLLSLDAQSRQRVMVEFNPRDTSRDANPIFHTFTRGILSGGKGKGFAPAGKGYKGAPAYPAAAAAYRGGYAAPSAAVAFGLGAAAQPAAAAMGAAGDHGAFVAQWNLGAEAQQVLYGLTPDLQARVVREFRPRDTSSDANNIFCKFARGVQAKGGGGGKGWGGADARFSPY